MRRSTSSIAAPSTPRLTSTASRAASGSSSRSSRAPRAHARHRCDPPSHGGPLPWRAHARRVRSDTRSWLVPVLRPRTAAPALPAADGRARRLKRSFVIVRTAFVSTYPPRHCGIAAFTTDLATNTSNREVVALHPPQQTGEPYPIEVHHRIRKDEPADYLQTAAALRKCVDVVSV